MEKKLKVEEVYECIALLGGFNNPQSQLTVVGFSNEKGISEGMRRIANKTFKKLNENWPKEQLEQINQPIDEKIEGEEKIAILNEKQAKMKELLESEVTIVFEELPDFKLLDDRLEDRKEKLSYNYTYIFERLFQNY